MLLPYLRKLKEDPTLQFDPKYIVTFFVCVVMATVASLVIFAGYEPPEGDLWRIFSISFVTKK